MKTKQVRNTALFVGCLLLAGVCNVFSRSDEPLLNTVLFCVNFAIYAGLLLFWMQSVRSRLLPTSARSYIVAAVILMLAYLLVRVFKYRVAGAAVVLNRYAVYAYWTPQMLIPALFLMTCLRIRRGEQKTRRWMEALLLVPACALSLMALTNDLHSLVYMPKVVLRDFTVATGTYSLRPGFYLMYVWMGAAALAGLVLLVRQTGKRPPGTWVPFIVLVLMWPVLIYTCTLVFERFNLSKPYGVPEIQIFCMLGFFELCIRNRLMPYNENYAGFFSQLDLPARITDRSFATAWQTAAPVKATQEQLAASLDAPVYPDEDTRLSGMAIRAGYAFWTEDERALHAENRRLTAANELLSEENDLIAVENQLKEKQVILDAQNRVYDRIAAALFPQQKQIETLLADISPDSPDFAAALGKCCLLNAYSKRKSNLLLLSGETLPRPNRELFLALQESARALRGCGVEAAAVGEEYSSLPLEAVHALYDAFETVLETWLPALRRMTVSLMEDGVRLAVEGAPLPELPALGLQAERRESEDYTFLSLRAKTGGEGG